MLINTWKHTRAAREVCYTGGSRPAAIATESPGPGLWGILSRWSLSSLIVIRVGCSAEMVPIYTWGDYIKGIALLSTVVSWLSDWLQPPTNLYHGLLTYGTGLAMEITCAIQRVLSAWNTPCCSRGVECAPWRERSLEIFFHFWLLFCSLERPKVRIYTVWELYLKTRLAALSAY